MSATNSTTNYNLPVFVGTDKPAWLTDWNGAMNIIDGAINSVSTAQQGDATAISTLNSSVQALGDTVSGHTTAITSLNSQVSGNTGSINTINSLIGNGEPTTTDKTIIGAINELNAKAIDADHVGYDNATSGLTSDNVQEAIDEVAGRVNASTFGNIIDIAVPMASTDGYTAPSDGYVFVTCQSTSGYYIKYSINGAIHTVVGGSGFYPSDLMPVKKGMVIKTGTTDYTSPIVYGFYPLS